MRLLTCLLACLLAFPVVADPDKVEHFQGYMISLELGGKATSKLPRENNKEQLWTIKDKLGGKLTVKLTKMAETLGDFKGIQIVINPIKDGKPDMTDMWRPADMSKFKPGEAFAITKWMHIGGGKFTQPETIAPGSYQANITINGAKNWDRQSIRIVVE